MQFDLYVNPINAARANYPYVVSLQSDLMDGTAQHLVAPLIPKHAVRATSGRLMPTVSVNTVDHVVLVPALSAIPRRDLVHPIASLAASRAALLAAVDYVFYGV